MAAPEGTTLTGKQVQLRPLYEQDYKILYNWRSDSESLHLWSHPRRLLSFSEFVGTTEKALHSEIDIWLLALSKETGQPVGFVYSYDTSSWDGFTFLAVFIANSARGQGIGREIGILFVRYLMDYFPFRKIYADVFEFNAISRSFVTDYGFVEEGRFYAHRYYQGRYWDMLRLALYRDRWQELQPRLSNLTNRAHPHI